MHKKTACLLCALLLMASPLSGTARAADRAEAVTGLSASSPMEYQGHWQANSQFALSYLVIPGKTDLLVNLTGNSDELTTGLFGNGHLPGLSAGSGSWISSVSLPDDRITGVSWVADTHHLTLYLNGVASESYPLEQPLPPPDISRIRVSSGSGAFGNFRLSSDISAGAVALSDAAVRPEENGFVIDPTTRHRGQLSGEIIHDRTYVSLSEFVNASGLNCWQDTDGSWKLTDTLHTLTVSSDWSGFSLDEQPLYAPLPVFPVAGDIRIPLRQFADCFGMRVHWDGTTQLVSVAP